MNMLLEKLLKARKVGTHDEEIHGDEVTAKVVIDEALETVIAREDIKIELVRSRNKEVLATCDLMFDVGGENEPYDHHKSIREKRLNGIFYSSVGLLWRDLGEEIIKKYAPLFTDEQVQSAVQRVDEQFILGICAEDNGQKIYQSEHPIKTYYQIIYDFNLLYEDKVEAFQKATELSRIQLKLEIKKAIEYIEVKSILSEKLKSREVPEILVLDKYSPWNEPVIELDKDVLFVVFPSSSGLYMVQAVETVYMSYINRKNLPESWKGLRDKEFEAVTGVEGSEFCHAGLFIAGARTLEGAIELAKIAINNENTIATIINNSSTICPNCKSNNCYNTKDSFYICKECGKELCSKFSPKDPGTDLVNLLYNCSNCSNYDKCIENNVIPF